MAKLRRFSTLSAMKTVLAQEQVVEGHYLVNQSEFDWYDELINRVQKRAEGAPLLFRGIPLKVNEIPKETKEAN